MPDATADRFGEVLEEGFPGIALLGNGLHLSALFDTSTKHTSSIDGSLSYRLKWNRRILPLPKPNAGRSLSFVLVGS